MIEGECQNQRDPVKSVRCPSSEEEDVQII